MPKISEILVCAKTAREDAHISGTLAQFAALLHIDIQRAKDLFSQYGEGQIYTPQGLVFGDREAMRNKVKQIYRYAVVITNKGEVIYLSCYKTRKENFNAAQLRKEIAQKREEREERKQKREYYAYRADKEREQMFEDCKGRPSHKKQGTIPGTQYVKRRGTFRVDEFNDIHERFKHYAQLRHQLAEARANA